MATAQKNHGSAGARHTSGADRRSNEEIQHVTEQFTEFLGLSEKKTQELASETSKAMDAVTHCGAVLAQGAQEISREWMKLAGDRLQRNLEGLNELAQCRTVPEIISVQSRLMSANLEHMLRNSRRIAEISLQVVSEAGQATTEAAKKVDHARQAA